MSSTSAVDLGTEGLRRPWSTDGLEEDFNNMDLINTNDTSSTNSTNPFLNGQMDLEMLWRLLEQRHSGGGATGSGFNKNGNVIGLDEDKILETQARGHSMTTLGKFANFCRATIFKLATPAR